LVRVQHCAFAIASDGLGMTRIHVAPHQRLEAAHGPPRDAPTFIDHRAVQLDQARRRRRIRCQASSAVAIPADADQRQRAPAGGLAEVAQAGEREVLERGARMAAGLARAA
jgi:hypothetical protein